MDCYSLGGMGLVFVIGGADCLDDVVLEALRPFHLNTLISLDLAFLDYLDGLDDIPLDPDYIIVDIFFLIHDLDHSQ